jgi:type IV secretory pathway TraG/TraD family ATPase VirD4
VCIAVTALVLAAGSSLAAMRRRSIREVHRRGAIVSAVTRRCWRRRTGRLSIAGVAIPAPDECKHFKLIGTTGTGKSTAIRELLSGALARGDRAVIADPDGGYLRRFYDRYRGDVILNPFESYAVRWDPAGELREAYDADELARSLIPEVDDASGREWRGYARTFLAAVARHWHATGEHRVADLWRLLMVAPSEELRCVVAHTPAQPFLEPENARMFSSIRSVTGSAVAALEYIKSQRAAPFCVREWVRSGRGVLFIPYRATQIAALRSMIATWMRLAIFETMSCAEEGDRHLWFVLDELDALGAIDGLKDALVRVRKFGGRCVLGFQSIAQVSCTYGNGTAQTLVENCANTLILRCAASEHGGTAQFASRLIGEREIVRRQIARGRDRQGLMSSRGARHSTQVSEQHAHELAIMPSQIEQLPDLAGYLKIASSPMWKRVRLETSERWRSST